MTKHSQYYWLFIAGFLAGLAEVVWIGFYSLITDMQLSQVGSAITATVYSHSSEFYLSPVLGLMIHMVLSVLLAFGFGLLLWPIIERMFRFKAATMIASVATVVIVWKINFFLLLPMWSSEFIGLMPLSVTLISKILFGMTMGTVLTVYQQSKIAPPILTRNQMGY